MKKKILLLEDDRSQAKNLQKIIHNYSKNIEITYATTIAQAKDFLTSNILFDAFFLDISLGVQKRNQDGLQLAEQLQAMPRYQRTPILFITAFPQYIYPALNQLHCFAYLIKPYSEKEIHQQLATLFESKRTLLLKTSENIHIRLPLDTLQYIRAQGRYMTFVTTSSRYCSRQYTLKELTRLLPGEFLHCHKSYIINQSYVDNFDFVNHFAHMLINDEVIPLSRNFHP